MKRISRSNRIVRSIFASCALLALGLVLARIHHEHINRGLVDATEQGNIASMRLMLQRGAEVNLPVTDRLVKPTAATYFKNALHGPLRTPHKRKATLLMVAVSAGRTDAARLLLERGAYVDAHDEFGFTPLSMAISVRRPDLVRLLLSYGADPNAGNELHMPPLLWALLLRQTESACALLDAGADANGMDADGMPALYLATLEEDSRAVKALLAHGADADAAFKGSSTLQLAVSQGDPDIVRALLQRGAHTAARSPDGRTLLELARSEKRSDIVYMLQHSGMSKQVAGP